MGYSWTVKIQNYNGKLLQVCVSLINRGANGIMLVFDVTS
jgi:hypothetical protein